MRKYDAAVFDLDGTLLDTSEGIRSSVSHVIKIRSLPDIDEDTMRSFIGPPMQRSFARVFGLEKEEAVAAANDFRNNYKDKDLLRARPYEGIYDTLKALREAGVKCAVATYKRQDYAERILTHFGFDPLFDVVCGADPEGKFTKSDIIENAIRLTGISDRKRAVMIGDSDNDAEGAAGSKVDFLGVSYGFGFGDVQDVIAHGGIGCADEPAGILEYVI